MRLLQFAKWWWKNNDGVNRSIAAFVIWILLTTPFIFPVGGIYAVILMALIYFILVILTWFLYDMFLSIKNSWKKFNRENPTEEQRIISRLRGDDLT